MSFNTSSMKKIFAFLLFGCLYASSFGQVFTKDTIAPNTKYSIGFYPSLYYYDWKVENEEFEFARFFSLGFRPAFTYKITHNIFMSTIMHYEFNASNFYTKDSFIEIGIAARYVLPYTINVRALKKLHFYFEAQYHRTNYRLLPYTVKIFEFNDIVIKEDFIISDGLQYNKLVIPLGITVPFTKRLYLDINWQYWHFISGKSFNGFMGGVYYNF
ncbi:MAG: hypothetical protein BWY22_00622 [Bacteroidetes bacterium ADurb.Bin217]|nr:MAG: hypothetical protein BWY22_00622 [Bacteroidetes bacterium ADurb.Bin217]